MRTIVLRPGAATPADCIADTRRGLYVKSVGGGTVDIARGDFVFQVTEGYRVEDGRVGAPVRGATLVGKGPEVLAGTRIVADDFAVSPGMWTCGKLGQTVPVNVGQPHAKIDAITVGGTGAGGA
jgi:TldD protein